MRILFLHGWHSIVGGTKPTFLKEAGHSVINPSLDDEDFEKAVRTAQHEFDRHQPDVVVGSSRGGAVALNINSGETPLVLLCPAWKNWGSARTLKSNSVILHSRSDDVIPFDDSVELVANSGLPAETLIEVGSDHRLADPKPLQAMLDACLSLGTSGSSILDHPAISGAYLFPQSRTVNVPFSVEVNGAELACYRRGVDPENLTMVHFHGNGEAVADYVPDMAWMFEGMGLNSLFVEYREYGGSTGRAQLAAMLPDGEAAIAAAGLQPERCIAFGRSIGSLYAIELVNRLPGIGGLIIESGIADPSERFLAYADLAAAGVAESDVLDEVRRWFNHREKLQEYSNPVLILHAENDSLIEISHAERNFEWAGSEQKQFVRFPVGSHNSIFPANADKYLEAVKGFVESVGAQ